MPARRILEHLGDRFSRAGDLVLFLVKQDTLRQFKLPSGGANGDMIMVTSAEGDDQVPERLESEVRDGSGTRMAQGSYAGRIDHEEKRYRMEFRCPAALGGTDTIMGENALTALLGDSSKRIVNSQTEVVIDSIQAHTADHTIIRVTAGATDFIQGDIVAHRSYSTLTTHGDGIGYLITDVDDAPGGGSIDLTLRPRMYAYPTAATDKIQGGITWKPKDTIYDPYSDVEAMGFFGACREDCCIPNATINTDGRSLMTMEFGIHARKSMYSGIAHVKGDASTDKFLTTDTILSLHEARFLKAGTYVDLPRFTIAAGGVGTLASTETAAKVASVDVTNGRVTLVRGSTPVEAQTAYGLQAVTTATEEEAIATDSLTITAGDFLRIELDRRGYIDVPLTAGASKDAVDIVADINAALQQSELYGKTADGPYAGVDWSTAASVSALKVRLTSQTWGSQSQIKATLTGLSGDRFTDVWTPAATWEIEVSEEIQIVPHRPSATESRDPIGNKDGFCMTDGNKLLVASAVTEFDNQMEHLEDVKTGDDYEMGWLEGVVRKISAAISLPAFGWTARLRYMAEQDEGAFISHQSGQTKGASICQFFPKAKASGPSVGGDNRQDVGFTFTAEDPDVTDTYAGTALREYYIGLV